MKILIINTVCGIRSTGRIATAMAEEYILQGHECVIAYGREAVPQQYRKISYRIGTDFGIYTNALKARFLDNEAFNAKRATKKFIKWANSYDPDVLCLHNLHGYYINIKLLFDWIKSRPKMQVKWTLHDCWAFTGHCAHFSFVGCHRWKTGCHNCPQLKKYPAGLFLDGSKKNYLRKKACFGGVENMTITVPSHWLANLVKQSFLGEYPVEVVHNTVNTQVFKPTESDFRQSYGLQDKYIVLGVATAWDDRKGLCDFIKLSKLLDKHCKVVLVGLDEKQIKKMPEDILCIPRTNSVKELAEIYTAADLFLNLSREETFGLTTVEALSCGTYPIVYKNTACEEVVNCYGGMAVEQDVNEVVKAIKSFYKKSE